MLSHAIAVLATVFVVATQFRDFGTVMLLPVISHSVVSSSASTALGGFVAVSAYIYATQDTQALPAHLLTATCLTLAYRGKT